MMPGESETKPRRPRQRGVVTSEVHGGHVQVRLNRFALLSLTLVAFFLSSGF
jgi:hypothetical protein